MQPCGNVPKESLTDKELVVLAKNEDAAAFSILSERYMPLLRQYASRYSSLVSVDAEDFLQEGLLALFKAVQGYNPEVGVQFNTYAFTSINNAMISIIRKQKKTLSPNFSISIEEMDTLRLLGGLHFHSRQKPVEDQYFDREQSRFRMQQMEDLLSDFEQRVLRLYLRGYTYQRISRVLSTHTKAVDNALQRVRRKLRPEF